MTNSEYFERNQISSDHVELKFKIGDTVVLQLNDETKGNGWKHNVIFKIMSFDNSNRFYKVKYLMPHEGGTCLHYPHAIGDIVYLYTFYVDRNCELY